MESFNTRTMTEKMVYKKRDRSLRSFPVSSYREGMKQLETSLLSIIEVSILNILRYKNHLKLIGGAIGLLVATLIFSVWFALISLDKSCIRTKLDMISPIGIELKRTLETRLLKNTGNSNE